MNCGNILSICYSNQGETEKACHSLHTAQQIFTATCFPGKIWLFLISCGSFYALGRAASSRMNMRTEAVDAKQAEIPDLGKNECAASASAKNQQ